MCAQRSLSVGVVAGPEATASTLYGLVDFFASVGRDWEQLVEGRDGASCIRTCLVAARREGFCTANGVFVEPERSFDEAGIPDLVCVPDLAVLPDERLGEAWQPAAAWLRACYAGGATLASACSGALLLAEAGLLDGLDATTHWAYCDALRDRHPAVRVHPARSIVASGDAQRIVTAGGGFSWLDLALFLVARFFGEEEAMRQARLHLVDWHREGQLPFAVLARVRQCDDAVIRRCQAWAAEHFREASPVRAMVAQAGLPERSFARRFSRATGMTPLEYVHTLRLEDAKQRLETTDTPVESIALEVGYEDASFFRRLFRRKVGLRPVDYRRRFRPLRQALGAARETSTAGARGG